MAIVVVVLYLVHYNTLLRIATNIITKCVSFFYYKIRRILQNVNAITKCDVFYKVRQRNVLQRLSRDGVVALYWICLYRYLQQKLKFVFY